MEYSNSAVREIAAEYIHHKRDRELICDRLTEGMTIEALAGKYELSVSQVKRIILRDSDIIYRHIEKMNRK